MFIERFLDTLESVKRNRAEYVSVKRNNTLLTEKLTTTSIQTWLIYLVM